MLESLKDLYISHPFLPVADAPVWFSHIKDIRCVLVYDAVKNILEYKNGNYVRAWVVGLTDSSIRVKVECRQLSEQNKFVDIPTFDWTLGVPNTQSYALIDSDFAAPETFAGQYELNPDVLVIMQKAPAMYINGVKQPVGLDFDNGYNVSVSKNNNGVLLYGGAGAGKGSYTFDPLGVLGDWQQNLGLRNINGKTDDIWIKGTFPVKEQFEKVSHTDPITNETTVTPNFEFSAIVEEA